MCLIRIGRVVKVDKNIAICDFDGVLKEANSLLFPKLKSGDDVVINSGFISDIVKNKQDLYKQMISTDALSTQLLEQIDRYSKLLKQKEIVIFNKSDINDYLIKKYSLEEFLPKKIKVFNISSNFETFDENNKNILEFKHSTTEILEEVLTIIKTLYEEV